MASTEASSSLMPPSSMTSSQICPLKAPRKAISPSTMRSKSRDAAGRFTLSSNAASPPSNEGITTSAAARSARTSGIHSREPLVNTTTGTSVMALMPRMMSPSPECSVGSPDPAKLMYSGLSPFWSLRRTSSRISAVGIYSLRSMVWFVVRPSWQYTQSNEQLLKVRASTPRERPRRREGTGPYTCLKPVFMFCPFLAESPAFGAMPRKCPVGQALLSSGPPSMASKARWLTPAWEAMAFHASA